jgi:UDP-N-acetylglucosamine transferase subunit ALG13
VEFISTIQMTDMPERRYRIMIFVTLGSQKFQFDRLLEAVDKLKTNEEIFAQIGYSGYKPKNYKYKNFLDKEEFDKAIDEASVIITHGGTGAIISAIKKGKRVIAVPRLAKYKEHVDDHQLQLVKQFKDLDLICECLNVEKLNEALDEVKNKKYKKYKSNTKRIIDSIRACIES